MNSVPSAAAQVLVTVIPIVGIVMGSIVIFFYLLWNYKQKVYMIQKGIEPTSTFDLDTFSLLAGLLTLGIGFVLFVFFLAVGSTGYDILGGLIPLAIGISFICFFIIRRKFSS
ncbi:MAG: hypothetical protein ACLFST_03870 [Spirochaetia bacterium]